MQSSLTIMGWNLAAVTALMICGWLVSIAHRNVTIVDSLWGLGFVLIAWLTFFLSDGFWTRKMLIAVLVTLWGLRLSAYLSWRNWGKGEDPRYGLWREKKRPALLVRQFVQGVYSASAVSMGDFACLAGRSNGCRAELAYLAGYRWNYGVVNRFCFRVAGRLAAGPL